MKKIFKPILLTSCAIALASCLASCDIENIKNNDEIKEYNNTNDSSDVDFIALTTKLSTETIEAHVRIEASFYQRSRMSYQMVASSIGSGVIIEEVKEGNRVYYYCLTNNHVIYNEYSYATYVVEDCYENEFSAEVIYQSSEYDLALLKFEFKDSTDELKVIELAESDPETDELVATLGESNAISNTLTYGYITGTKVFNPNVETINESNVTFEVLTHDAYIQSGCSGGSLLNVNSELVGINFASSYLDDKYLSSYAIPVSKIKEFIEICEQKDSNFIYE